MSNAISSVLHISRADNQGGSARSAYKIHSGLRQQGWQSRMMVQIKVTGDPDVAYLHGGNKVMRTLDYVGRYVIDPLGLQYLYYPSSFAMLKHAWYTQSQIVQLYNVHGGFFTLRVLPRMSQQKIVVWRLSDMWPFTGHCSYSQSCERWRTGCGSCPLLSDYPALTWDSTALLWRFKKGIYERSKLVFVATNSWMEKQVQASPLIGRFPVHRIPNGVDTTIFRPLDKAAARKVLDIPPDARVVLFLAHVAMAGTRKGGQHVIPAMQKLAATGLDNLLLLVAGEGSESWPDDPAYRTLRIGYSQSDRLLAVVYSAADVLIYPAVAENFPNVVIESMSCGTPPVAFETGGVMDAVHHEETGYLAPFQNTEALAEGMHRLLSDPALHERISRQCRAAAEQEYSQERQVERFAKLYQSLLDQA